MARQGSELFLVMPPITSDGQIFFAKNSVRPSCEVQEVIYVPSCSHEPSIKLRVSTFEALSVLCVTSYCA